MGANVHFVNISDNILCKMRDHIINAHVGTKMVTVIICKMSDHMSNAHMGAKMITFLGKNVGKSPHYQSFSHQSW